jgi:hypothetical protein
MSDAFTLEVVVPRHEPRACEHYSVNAIRGDGMPYLRTIKPDDLNYVFLSTSGVHGSYTNLDEIEMLFDPAREKQAREYFFVDAGDPLPTEHEITFCVLQPRKVTTIYGNALVRSLDDVAFLRRLTELTIAGVAELQKGNREKR